MKNLHEGIDFFVRIIECKGRTDRALESEMALGRKCAVMAGAHCYPMLFQMVCDILNRDPRDNE
jgi:hypothetical protein